MNDEKFYKIVADELENKKLDKGLWLKALTKANHNEALAKTLYVKWRVKQISEAKKEFNKQEKRELELQPDLRKCPQCKDVMSKYYKVCVSCGFNFKN